ncbi:MULTISPECIES: IS21 family transposase [unclassified Neptuniibacter]|uniref:IS21 family transposase n=1 Tax=unclassified Neptuniibacter TaxID=2630693 RepID=UPI000C433C6F|nr:MULTISPECIES: IS21 family transposase [unclassified Neptuniibacter]MAY42509.1 transposase [Oceanospirillaceae bacterium]|tara:strand:+ start:18119 stop:19681 length:1563 start_codon:yes stop_codon:yes gene_type:complete
MRTKTPILREIIRFKSTTTYSNRQIAEVLEIAPNTVRHYSKQWEGIQLSFDEIKGLKDQELLEFFINAKGREVSKQMPDYAVIHQRLRKEKYLTLQVLWEEYRATFKEEAYCYAQFTHYYRRYVKKIDITMRQRHYPGEAMFVDYAGTRIPWLNLKKGKRKEYAQVFVAVLGHSDLTFAWASRSQNSEDWIEAHNQALAFFGGVPEAVIPDNLKSAVIKTKPELVLNRTYKEMSKHYEFVILPSRVRRPQDKAKAEHGVLLVTRWIIALLKERLFYSIEEINQAILELLLELNNRSLRNYPGTRLSRFEEGDKLALRPLPEKPFEYAVWEPECSVGKDYHIKVQRHWYSVPFHLIGEKVEARISFNMVEIYYQNQRIAFHRRSTDEGGFTTDKAHMSPAHQSYSEQDLSSFVEWARQYGPATEAVIRAQFDKHHSHSMVARSACNQLLKLANLYEPAEFESACSRAVDIASLTVKSVRSILRTGLYKLVHEDVISQAQLPLHENVRGASYYAQGGLKDVN